MDDGSSSSNSRWTMPLQKLGTKQYYLGIFFKVSNTFTYVNRLLKTIHIKKCLGIKLSVVIPNEKKGEKIRESQQQCCNFGLYRSGFLGLRWKHFFLILIL